MKLAVNTIIFGLNEALAEALVLAEQAGIDRRSPTTSSRSAIGPRTSQYKRAAFLEPGRTPAAFALDLAAKDLRLIRDLADEVGARMPQADVNLDVAPGGGRASGGSDFGSRDRVTTARVTSGPARGAPA